MLFANLLDILSHAVYLLLHVTGAGSFLRLVAHIVKKYYVSGSDQEDLISIGTIGLIKAVDTFDAGKGIRLSSYASKCIENGTVT